VNRLFFALFFILSGFGISDVHALLFAQVPAFPDAKGHGTAARGGRGGRVLYVNTLADSVPGAESCTATRCTLRAAVETPGPRIILFKVAGVIDVTSRLDVSQPYMTIAGQSAPGSGITVRAKSGMAFFFKGDVHDVVIRFLRIRGNGGQNSGGNLAVTVGSGYNIVFDHCSFSWKNDTITSIYRYPDSYSWARDIRDITFQRCMIYEGETGSGVKGETGLSFNGIVDKNGIPQWYEVERISLHHNLWANMSHRLPMVHAKNAEIINNVMYNFNQDVVSNKTKTALDVIGNFFKTGPLASDSVILGRKWGREISHEFRTNISQAGLPDAYQVIGLSTVDGTRGPSLYVAGNIGPSNPDGRLDNWVMTSPYKHDDTSVFGAGLLQSVEYDSVGGMPRRVNGVDLRRFTRLPQGPFPVAPESASAAYNSIVVSGDVGASARIDEAGRWVNARDEHDQRVLSDTVNRTGPGSIEGIHSRQTATITVVAGTPWVDADSDGMADIWEVANGLSPGNPSDGNIDSDGDGYTNVEEFLNGSQPTGLSAPTAPQGLRVVIP